MSVRELKHDRPSGRFSKYPRFVCKRCLPFFPTPPRSFTYAIFRAVFDSRSSFFAPKQHGNACYAGYNFRLDYVFVWKAHGEVPRASEESPIAKKMW